MGIPGLLKELNALVGTDAHISAYKGKRVAVDASGWLHRSTYSCALELLLGTPTTGYVALLKTLLLTLLDHEVVPVIVFDGAYLPAKQRTNAQREANRLRHQSLALHYHSVSNAELATYHAQHAVSVTPAITHAFLALCRESNVDFLVAPYEADAQMAQLVSSGDVYACVTEDSDLVAFGCDRLFIKLERTGVGREIVVADLLCARPVDAFVRRLKNVYAEGGLLGMCVLSGCDYLPSLKGMGLRTAAKWWSEQGCIELIVSRLRQAGKGKRKKGFGKAKARSGDRAKKKKSDAEQPEVKEEAERCVVDLIEEVEDGDEPMAAVDAEDGETRVESDDEESANVGKLELYDDYALEFHKALLTFRHMLVYDRREARYAHLHALPRELQRLSPLNAAAVPGSPLSPPPPPASLHDSTVSLSSRLSESGESRQNARLTCLDFLGLPPPGHLTEALIAGRLNPKTLRPLVGEEQSIHAFFTLAGKTQEREGGKEAEVPVPVPRTVSWDVERVFADVEGLLEGRAWQSSASPLQKQREESASPASARKAAAKRPKTASELAKERRDREEQRSTGGGLRRFFSATVAQSQ